MFCYSVIKVFSFLFFAKAFIFYHITSFLSRIFLKNFFIFFRRFLLFLRCELLYINTRFLICQEVFNFLFKSVTFSFQKCVSHVQRILYYHNSRVASSIFWGFFLFSKKVLDIVFFLYFYHSRCISGSLNCYFFINI